MLKLIPASEITTRREQLIKKLQEWISENGRIPKEFDLLHNPKYPQRRKKYTRKQLIEVLQKWGKDNNKIPVIKDFDKAVITEA